MLCPEIADLPSSPPGQNGWPWTSAPTPGWNQLEDLPKISIVTPSYNQGQFIEETIRSVLLQGYPNLEYYVIDGGSTDQTLEVLRKYEPWLSGWVSEPDEGQSDAINKGWRRCTGAWLGWMNSDDTYLPGALWSLAQGIRRCSESAVVVGNALWTDVAGRPFRRQDVSSFDYISFLLSLSNHLPSGSAVLRRSVVERIGGLDASMPIMMDTDLWMQAGLHSKVYTIPKVLSTFRYHADCKTHKPMSIKIPDLLRIYDKLYGQADLPPNILRLKSRAYSFCYLEAAYYACRSDERLLCWHYLAKSLRASWRHVGVGHISVAIQNVLGKRLSNSIRIWLPQGDRTEQETSSRE